MTARNNNLRAESGAWRTQRGRAVVGRRQTGNRFFNHGSWWC